MSTTGPSLTLPFENSHAFLIGIDAYEHISPLTTAVNDAQALAEKLATDHGYDVFPPLINATKAEMEKLFSETIPKLVDKNDRIFFYFAGHGIALNSDADPQGYFVPADAMPNEEDSLVSMDLLHDALHALPCKHGMMIMDCCFAGSFKWSSTYRDVLFNLPSVIYEERFYQYAKDSAWQVITSSASDQKAVDILSNRILGMRDTEGEQHSPFAQALLDGLDGAADTIPKEGGDGVITATELYSYLRDRVEDETMDHGMRQSPSFFSLNKHDKGQYIFLHPRHRLNLPPIPDRNPYMGLRSYNEIDNSLFFGRDRVVADLKNLVKNNSLVVISGASGTGKSSAIKAGLIPALRQQGWDILPVIRPGQEPMKSLMMELPHLDDLLHDDRQAVLLVDQYEELITQCHDPNERIDFENLLAFWVQGYPQLHIVISLRSDFEPQFIHGPLSPWWYIGHYAVPTFSQDELREIIIKPTIQEVLFFEPESLVDKLMDAVNQAPGALPLLSFTLSELYHAYLKSGRTNRAFTLEDYEKLGGVIGALHTRANTVYDGLDEAHQNSMRKLMLRMVSLEGGEVASRRVLEEDLRFVDPVETARVDHVAQLLVNARLVSTGRDKRDRVFYEPAHDALVRAWGRLWDWIKGIGEDTLGLMYKLSLAVEDYQHHLNSGKAKEYLWQDDPRLNLMIADLGTKTHHFNAPEEDFLRMSIGRRQQVIQRKQRRRVITFGVLLALSIISFILNGNAQLANYEAQKNAKSALLAKIEANDKAFEARLAELEACDHEEEARRQKETAELEKRKATEALHHLELNSQSMVTLILEDAKQDIVRLRYDAALSKYRKAFALRKNPDEVARGLMELAFFYGETGKIELAKGLLDTIAVLHGHRKHHIHALEEFHDELVELHPLIYDTIYHRYYPELVDVKKDSSLLPYLPALPTNNHVRVSKKEITVWQYHLYISSYDSLRMPPTPLWKNDGRLPVVALNIEDVGGYMKWLGARTQHSYRAPTRAEAPYISRDSVWLFTHRLSAYHGSLYDFSHEAIQQAGFHVCQIAEDSVRKSD